MEHSFGFSNGKKPIVFNMLPKLINQDIAKKYRNNWDNLSWTI